MSKRPAPRRSLLAGMSPVDPPTDQPQPASAPEPVKAQTKKPKRAAAAAKPRPAAAAASTSRLGVYLPPEHFAAAKAAYLHDFMAGGEADALGRWVGQALARYAAKTPQQRAKTTHVIEPGAGQPRSFVVPDDDLAAMRAAMNEDRTIGRWLTASAWAGEAIAAATEASRKAAGGTLPPAPARLPNRLTR